MRHTLVAAVAVCLLVGASFGAINVKLVAEATSLSVGDQTTIDLMAMGTQSGVNQVVGAISATPSNSGVLQSSSLVWAWPFASLPGAGVLDGTPGANGDWLNIAGGQTLPVIANLGKTAYVLVCSYTVKALKPGSVSLSFIPGLINGCRSNEIGGPITIGTVTGTAITVTTPEPTTLALLALAGLVAARRKR